MSGFNNNKNKNSNNYWFGDNCLGEDGNVSRIALKDDLRRVLDMYDSLDEWHRGIGFSESYDRLKRWYEEL